MSKEVYFFYNGNPYKEDIHLSNKLEIAGRNLWNNNWTRIKKSEVKFCKEDEIEKIFIDNCKEAIKLNLIGWTSEKAKDLEEKAKEYLTKKWKYYLLECPNSVYEACQEGKYGIIYNLSSIRLSEELQIKNKPCSDGIIRNEKEYIRFLLGKDWSLIRLFMLKWPMLKFKYDDLSKADEPFPDICCMVPFYNDNKVLSEIQNSILL